MGKTKKGGLRAAWRIVIPYWLDESFRPSGCQADRRTGSWRFLHNIPKPRWQPVSVARRLFENDLPARRSSKAEASARHPVPLAEQSRDFVSLLCRPVPVS
jgi:hypothetical protein